MGDIIYPLISTISKIEYLIGKLGNGDKSASRLLLIQVVFLVLLLSLFALQGKAFSQTDNNSKEDFSLFSSDLSLSQGDNKKENSTGLVEEGLQQDIDEGVVTALNNSQVVDTANEEQGIVGQDYATGQDVEKDDQKREAVEYYVQNGDTLSSVAAKFDLNLQTLLWANRLDILSAIQPGDKLTIPPEDGIMYTVKPGDTLLAVAVKYSSDSQKIAQFNQLDANTIVEGQILFLPGGKMPAEPAPSSALASNDSSSSLSSSSSSSSLSSSSSSSNTSYSTPKPVVRRYTGGGNHRFPYGYCTWYVASRRGDVSWGGNASAWLGNASAAGRSTGNTPVPGSIMVTRESWWGHVAYVESVSGNSVTISEMNYAGWGRVSHRTLSKSSWKIRGYIY